MSEDSTIPVPQLKLGKRVPLDHAELDGKWPFRKGEPFLGLAKNGSCLLKAGIKPSSSYYEMTAIKEALTRFYGVTPKIQCLPPEEGEKAQTIGQIEFCFTKELQLRNCTSLEGGSNPVKVHLKLGTEELSVCNDTLPTYYPSEVQDHK